MSRLARTAEKAARAYIAVANKRGIPVPEDVRIIAGEVLDTDSKWAWHEGRIIIDFGIAQSGGMEISTFVECPDSDTDYELPHRMQVEGAIMMARDSLDEIYKGES